MTKAAEVSENIGRGFRRVIFVKFVDPRNATDNGFVHFLNPNLDLPVLIFDRGSHLYLLSSILQCDLKRVSREQDSTKSPQGIHKNQERSQKLIV